MPFPLKWDEEFFVPDNGKPMPPSEVVVGRIDAILANSGQYRTSRGHSSVDYDHAFFRGELLFNPVEQFRQRRMILSGEFSQFMGFMDRGSIRIADTPGGLEVHVTYDLRRSLAIWALVGGLFTIALGAFQVGFGYMAMFGVAWCVLVLLLIRLGIRMLPPMVRRVAEGEFPAGPVEQLL